MSSPKPLQWARTPGDHRAGRSLLSRSRNDPSNLGDVLRRTAFRVLRRSVSGSESAAQAARGRSQEGGQGSLMTWRMLGGKVPIRPLRSCSGQGERTAGFRRRRSTGIRKLRYKAVPGACLHCFLPIPVANRSNLFDVKRCESTTSLLRLSIGKRFSNRHTNLALTNGSLWRCGWAPAGLLIPASLMAERTQSQPGINQRVLGEPQVLPPFILWRVRYVSRF